MQSFAIKTRVFKLGENLLDFVTESLKATEIPREGDVIALTSKVVSLAEECVVDKAAYPEKSVLIKEEADVYLGEGAYKCHLTVKHNILIPSAGIDESNSEKEAYILFPKDPFESARKLHEGLCRNFGLKNLGVIITDSHTTPLRRGVTGIALSHFGFKGVKSLIGQEDIYGRELQFTYVNHADALAVMAVYEMGEANEQVPLALIRGRTDLVFGLDDTRSDCRIPIEDDLYLPILQHVKAP